MTHNPIQLLVYIHHQHQTQQIDDIINDQTNIRSADRKHQESYQGADDNDTVQYTHSNHQIMQLAIIMHSFQITQRSQEQQQRDDRYQHIIRND
eukprot:CAMPEP_0197069760 /NCGR_PEP_ID=MMETSP1384-20130603/195413_1 /TAXON_ID=29189 /ORGANISM="Ammonia sp." /LENGTH=93 /DNA_ID=CAMNT_0042507923 /DNA_START=11 /DNA_END=289 /DNA_ORIENTATION=-